MHDQSEVSSQVPSPTSQANQVPSCTSLPNRGMGFKEYIEAQYLQQKWTCGHHRQVSFSNTPVETSFS